MKRNKTKRNETKQNETKRNKTKRKETKRKETNQNETKRNSSQSFKTFVSRNEILASLVYVIQNVLKGTKRKLYA